jgi:transcriptional regulator GlxA family with amidase domain
LALLAKAGVVNQRRATFNKMAFDFAVRQDPYVLWQRQVRWVVDGKYIASSGVSAGIDMALCLVEKLYGRTCAETIAKETKYSWNADSGAGPCAG